MLDFRTLVLAGTAFVTSLSPFWLGETTSLGPEANLGLTQAQPGLETAATTFGICCDPATGGCFNAPQPACPPPYQFIAGAVCGQGPCGSQPVGACCNPDTGACEVVFTPSACSGVFYSGKLCADVECPPNALGACCDPGVGCFEVPASQCPSSFAFYIGQFCANVDCGGPLTGACCDPNSGFCYETIQTACNYDFYPNQTCSSISCGVSLGACCDPNTGSCFEATPANCPFNFYPGQTCFGIVCESTGACCDTLSGFCSETPASQCIYTFYPGLTCSQITCVGTGACCDPNTGSCFEATPANCPFNFYPGQTCFGIVCESTGACCDTLSGFCLETPASQCIYTFYPGLTCSQITCVGDVLGACCIDLACVPGVTELGCWAAGGTWVGAGTDCFPSPCVPPLDYWLDLQGNVPVEQGGSGYQGTWFPYPNFWWNQWWPNEYSLQRQKVVKLRFWLEFDGPAPTIAFNYSDPTWTNPDQPPLPANDAGVIRVPIDPPPDGPGYLERELTLPFCPAWVSVDVRAVTPSQNLRIQGYIEHICLAPPVGACCYPQTGQCTMVPANECNGQYLGDNTTCVPNPCPQPTGACCLPNGDCIVTTQADCRCGDINGDGTPDAADLFLMALAWNSCIGDPAYNPDADLNGDGCVNGRDFQYFRLCVTVGTSYAGDGTTCDPNPCPKEACCFCDSSCQLLPPKTCIELGGLPVGSAACTANLCGYTKVNNPPDVDKPTPADPNCIPPGDNSCYLATAANMLAGAGYGTGTTMQARAQSIYNQLKAHFGCKNTGWVDTALSWWLASAHNAQPNNPYKVVTVYGNKTKTPYNRNDLPRFIGNELRRCQFVGLSISWPAAGGAVGGHAFTAWGDNGSAANLTRNPKCIKTTDSDTDAGGNVQTYTYDDPNNPNPGGVNNGQGHYINYSANHPFIKHIVTLCPTDSPTDNVKTQKVVGSYRIHQRRATPATDLHYKVGTDVDILTYRTTIDWPTTVPPTIVEDTTPARNLTVDWPTFATPIPQCKWVTITTEFIVPTWNSIKYKDVHFTYPPGTEDAMQIGELPDIRFDVQTPAAPDPNAPNISGGYVVARFELWGSPRGGEPLVEFALQHEYDPDQDPEAHNFILQSLGPVRGVGAALEVRNLRFGHSYGLLEDEELWQFNEWMTVVNPVLLPIGGEIQVPVDWEGLLPYPKGEDYVDCNENDTPDELDILDGTSLDANGNGIPDECETPAVCLGDVNCDGVVTFKDIDPFVARLGCPSSHPLACNTGCPWQVADINGDGAVTFADIDPFVGTLGTVCPAR